MPVLQWGMLCVLSLLLSIGFLAVHLPAALLLGPMIAGIIFSMRGITLQLPRSAFLAAQAILGCMIAQNLTGSILTTLAANWPIVLAILLVTLLSSAIVGWLLVRYSSLPGNTGAWGSSPGGAAAMVAMAQDYGADIRLVAFMQYLRVLFVAEASAPELAFHVCLSVRQTFCLFGRQPSAHPRFPPPVASLHPGCTISDRNL